MEKIENNKQEHVETVQAENEPKTELQTEANTDSKPEPESKPAENAEVPNKVEKEPEVKSEPQNQEILKSANNSEDSSNKESTEKEANKEHEENKNEVLNDDDSYEDVEDDEDDEEVNIEELKLKIEPESDQRNKDLKKVEESLNQLSIKKSETDDKPALAPVKKGNFYQHDNRDNNETEKKDSKQDTNKAKNQKWTHDKYEHGNKFSKKNFRPNKPRIQSQVYNKPEQTKPDSLPDQNRAQRPTNNKGVSLHEYMEQNDQNKQQKPAQINQTQQINQQQEQKQERKNFNNNNNINNQKKEQEKPTSSNNLKKRLDYSTRIPTIVDDLFLDKKPQPQYQHQQNHQKPQRFDKPFEKNDKFDLIITTDILSSKRQVTLNQPVNNQDRFGNYRPQFNRNNSHQESHSDYNQSNRSNNFNANNSNNNNYNYNNRNRSNRVNNQNDFGEYFDYSDYNTLDFDHHVKTQTFNNKNFNNNNRQANYDSYQSNASSTFGTTGPNFEMLEKLSSKPQGRPITRNPQHQRQQQNQNFH